MYRLILDKEIELGNNRKIIRKLWKVDKSYYYPKGLKFAIQFLYCKDASWIQIARIDNQLHRGKPGVHIHFYGKEEVKWEDMTFEEAKERVIDIGEKLLREMGEKNENQDCA